ncbi:S-adenosyl-L-methionine-dependent methyltransferase [Diplogelasinospora grovesii]|uniref:S-adenosyl-L-methionine-dependent methyltransferase n=1 Tax=Diplogelasinospora grovesii TaxID=303347 RepID=A0AAN6MXH4_9PEZI|nr:S-adenosyl-L-methionine-dependent methyltransferase [Diplogelasinospora grovesii]
MMEPTVEPIIRRDDENDEEIDLQEVDTSSSGEDLNLELLRQIMRGTAPRAALDYEILMLKRKNDTLKLHERFSANKGEKELQVLDRISEARKAARQIRAYTCISEYIFAEPRVDRHYLYHAVISEVRSSNRPLKLVDVGCCVGTDIRQLVHDGLPVENITGLDIERRFFNVGYSLYNQSPADFPVTFLQADILSPDFPRRFAHLRAQFDYVHSANVVHLFDYEGQLTFLRHLAFLVKPGGLVWGRQVGEADDSPTRSLRLEGKGDRFTPSEFMRMWRDASGLAGDMDWTSRLVPYDELRLVPDYKKNSLEWAVRMPVP